MTDNDGIWSGRNLPAEALRLLATKNVAPAQLATAAYDPLGRTVAFPRPPAPVALPVVE